MSGIVIMGQVFCSLVSGFLLDFQRVFWLCDSCFVGVLSWCVNSEWLLVSEAVIVSEWSKRRKGYHSRLPVTEMGVSLGWGLDLWSIRGHTFFFCKPGYWLRSEASGLAGVPDGVWVWENSCETEAKICGIPKRWIQWKLIITGS